MIFFPRIACVALSAGFCLFAPALAHAQAWPLCPGAAWTGAGPLIALAPAAPASASRSLRDLLAIAPAAFGARAPRELAALQTADAAARNLDPMMYRAYFGNAPRALVPLDIAPEIADQLKGLQGLDQTRGMVAPGNGTRPGGLDGVPEGVPVAFGTDAAGNVCVRPATAADWKLDSHTRQISRIWDPKGFRDVGILVTFHPDAVKNPYDICTLTRIAKGFAVTAAHCAIDSQRGEAIAPHDFTASSLRTLILTPRLDGTSANLGDCFDHPQTCGYFVSTPLGRPVLRPGTQWAAGSLAPVPDVALLAVAFDAGAPPASTGLAAQAVPGRLTIAAYGHTDATKPNTWGDLLVGWQQSIVSVDEKQLAWSVDVSGGHAGACEGDSGAPVYQGDFAGLPGESKRLGGVVSSSVPATGDGPDRNGCAHTGTNNAARLDTELAWICTAASGTISGCPGIRPVP